MFDSPKWIPIHNRKSKLGGFISPRKPDPRKPIFWLSRKDNKLHFVNDSNESLTSVSAIGGGFQTLDGDVAMVTNHNSYSYEDVKPATSALVEEYDDYYDRDFVLELTVTVTSDNLGSLSFTPKARIGGIGDTVLLYDNGESGKGVLLDNIEQKN